VLILPTHHPDVLAYLCRRQQDKVLVLLNLSKEKANFYITHPAISGSYSSLFTNNPVTVGRKESFSFAPGEYAVYHITMKA
jgi:hypothetical protein